MTTLKRTPTHRPLSRVERKQFKQDQNAWKPFADAVVRAGIRVSKDSATVKLVDFVFALVDEVNDVDFSEAIIRKIDHFLNNQQSVRRRPR
jgi:hypothetical protein